MTGTIKLRAFRDERQWQDMAVGHGFGCLEVQFNDLKGRTVGAGGELSMNRSERAQYMRAYVDHNLVIRPTRNGFREVMRHEG